MKDEILNDSKMPRILMIAPVFYPYPPIWPEGMVNAKLALAMKQAGWHVDIIVAGYPNDSSRYPTESNEWKELVGNIYIINYSNRKKVIQRFFNAIRGFYLTKKLLHGLDWGLTVLDVVQKLNSINKYDYILSRAIPDSAHFAALLVHKGINISWIANWNDPTPNHKFPAPYGDGPFSPLSQSAKQWYNLICKHCAWHLFPSERLMKYMSSYLPGNITSKSSVIPHIAMRKFSVPPVNHTGFSICYAGSVLPPREVSVFLEGIKRFKNNIEKEDEIIIRFLVDQPNLVLEKAKSFGIENIVRIEETVPYSKMPEKLAQSDILVIIEAPLKEGIFMPSKLADYAQIGCPILALSPPNGTISDILSKHGGGIAIDSQSPNDVAIALKTLYISWKAGALTNKYSSICLFDYLGENNVIELYRQLFKKLKDHQN